MFQLNTHGRMESVAPEEDLLAFEANSEPSAPACCPAKGTIFIQSAIASEPMNYANCQALDVGRWQWPARFGT